ncbi:MAG: hypothetical protein QRY16_13645 [Enterobacterales bacterium endosymbiont of Blomia tropicalis]|uniref:hypothetical protein n=1 Tax=Mixta mediterraneensis TaxID=2758443 RepID=UPI0025A8369D|nr:hypothetical protein [Mixta mediterraneensis]MDL4914797.1 hypothetical protein [Mixta mediterraneensis]
MKSKLITIITSMAIFSASADDSLIKGVNYFGSAWPINFWNSNDISKDRENLIEIKKMVSIQL